MYFYNNVSVSQSQGCATMKTFEVEGKGRFAQFGEMIPMSQIAEAVGLPEEDACVLLRACLPRNFPRFFRLHW